MGRLQDLLADARVEELRDEREELSAQARTLARQIAALDELIAVLEDSPDLPPLGEAIQALFDKQAEGYVALSTDQVVAGLVDLSLLGARSKASVNVALGRMVADGVLERPSRGTYALPQHDGAGGWGSPTQASAPPSDDDDIPF